MARAKSRGAEKIHQQVPGASGLEAILRPSIESVNITPREKKAISRLLWLGWLLYRARVRKADATEREKELKDEILEVMNRVPTGVVGVISRVGGRTRMHVEVVPNVGREVKNSLAVLRLLRRRKVNSERTARIEEKIDILKTEISSLQSQQTDPVKDALSLEQFLNLSKNAASNLKAANSVAKDAICRILFLNLVLDDKKRVSHTWKEPYATLMKSEKVQYGRGERTRTFDLAVPNRAR